MSSIAKSFPQPPTPLFFIFKTTEVSLPVVKTKAYCCQMGDAVPMMFPVSPDPKRTVSVSFQISNRTLIGISLAPQNPEPGLYTFITQAENSNVVLTHKPVTVRL